MLQKTHGQQYHAFFMDMHGGRIREIGSGRLPVEIYCEEFRKHDIKSTISGHAFIAGSDDVQGRMAETQKYMHIRGDRGTPELRVLRGACPDLEREMKRYKKKTQYAAGAMIVTDQPNTRGDVHACQCLEYMCAARPKYHKPPVKTFGEEHWLVKHYENLRKLRKKEKRTYVNLSPGGQ